MKMTKEQAVNMYRDASDFAKLHPLRKVAIKVFVAEALGLPTPPNCTPGKYVSYYVSDIRDACGLDENHVPESDRNFMAAELIRLEAEAKRAKKPEAKLFFESKLDEFKQKVAARNLDSEAIVSEVTKKPVKAKADPVS